MHRPSPQREVAILLVEDSPDDADLMVAALDEGSLPLHVIVVEDGETALSYLRRQGAYRAARRPDLILLDLRLPRMSGAEVLVEVRQDPDLRRIPVIVFTSAESDPAILAIDFSPNCLVGKPANQDEFREVVRKIERFWLTLAQLPRNP